MPGKAAAKRPRPRPTASTSTAATPAPTRAGSCGHPQLTVRQHDALSQALRQLFLCQYRSSLGKLALLLQLASEGIVVETIKGRLAPAESNPETDVLGWIATNHAAFQKQSRSHVHTACADIGSLVFISTIESVFERLLDLTDRGQATSSAPAPASTKSVLRRPIPCSCLLHTHLDQIEIMTAECSQLIPTRVRPPQPLANLGPLIEWIRTSSGAARAVLAASCSSSQSTSGSSTAAAKATDLDRLPGWADWERGTVPEAVRRLSALFREALDDDLMDPLRAGDAATYLDGLATADGLRLFTLSALRHEVGALDLGSLSAATGTKPLAPIDDVLHAGLILRLSQMSTDSESLWSSLGRSLGLDRAKLPAGSTSRAAVAAKGATAASSIGLPPASPPPATPVRKDKGKGKAILPPVGSGASSLETALQARTAALSLDGARR